MFNFYQLPNQQAFLSEFDKILKLYNIHVPRRNLFLFFENFASNAFENNEFIEQDELIIFLEIAKSNRNKGINIDDFINTPNSKLTQNEIVFKELTLQSLFDMNYSFDNIDYVEFKTSLSLYKCENCFRYFLSRNLSNKCDACRKIPNLFITQNEMMPSYKNHIFSNLSDVEKSLCSINTTVLKLFLTPYCSF